MVTVPDARGSARVCSDSTLHEQEGIILDVSEACDVTGSDRRASRDVLQARWGTRRSAAGWSPPGSSRERWSLGGAGQSRRSTLGGVEPAEAVSVSLKQASANGWPLSAWLRHLPSLCALSSTTRLARRASHRRVEVEATIQDPLVPSSSMADPKVRDRSPQRLGVIPVVVMSVGPRLRNGELRETPAYARQTLMGEQDLPNPLAAGEVGIARERAAAGGRLSRRERRSSRSGRHRGGPHRTWARRTPPSEPVSS